MVKKAYIVHFKTDEQWSMLDKQSLQFEKNSLHTLFMFHSALVEV